MSGSGHHGLPLLPTLWVEAGALYRVGIDHVKIRVWHKYFIIQIFVAVIGCRWTVWASNGRAPDLVFLNRLAPSFGQPLLPPNIHGPQGHHKGILRHRRVSARSHGRSPGVS